MKTIPYTSIPAGKMTEKQMAEHDLAILFNQLFSTNEKNPKDLYQVGMQIIEDELSNVAAGKIYKGGYYYDTKWLSSKIKELAK